MKLIIWLFAISFGVIFIFTGCTSVPKPERSNPELLQFPHTCEQMSMGGRKVLRCQ